MNQNTKPKEYDKPIYFDVDQSVMKWRAILTLEILSFAQQFRSRKNIRIDDLAHALDEQIPIVLRGIIEVNNANLVKTYKEGRNVFVSMTETLESPFLLKTI